MTASPTPFLWDGQAMVMATIGGFDYHFTHRPGVFGDLIHQFQERNQLRRFFLFDALGSVRGQTDASKNLTDTYVYDAYGQTLASTGSTPNDWFRWVGRWGYMQDWQAGSATDFAAPSLEPSSVPGESETGGKPIGGAFRSLQKQGAICRW